MHNTYADYHSSDPGDSPWDPERLQKGAIWALAMAICCAMLVLIAREGMASGGIGGELFVISNPNIRISDREIREVFSGTIQFIGTTRLVPVDNASAQASFLSSAMEMRASRYGVIWTKKSYREGVMPPVVKPDDVNVIDFVRRTPGAIGYVRLEPTGVNIVRRF